MIEQAHRPAILFVFSILSFPIVYLPGFFFKVTPRTRDSLPRIYIKLVTQQQQQVRIPQANELSSDDDSSPPKIRDPNQESEINIEDILKTMRKTKKEKEILNDTETELFKNIKVQNQKKGRKPKAKKQIN